MVFRFHSQLTTGHCAVGFFFAMLLTTPKARTLTALSSSFDLGLLVLLLAKETGKKKKKETAMISIGSWKTHTHKYTMYIYHA